MSHRLRTSREVSRIVDTSVLERLEHSQQTFYCHSCGRMVDEDAEMSVVVLVTHGIAQVMGAHPDCMRSAIIEESHSTSDPHRFRASADFTVIAFSTDTYAGVFLEPSVTFYSPTPDITNTTISYMLKQGMSVAGLEPAPRLQATATFEADSHQLYVPGPHPTGPALFQGHLPLDDGAWIRTALATQDLIVEVVTGVGLANLPRHEVLPAMEQAYSEACVAHGRYHLNVV